MIDLGDYDNQSDSSEKKSDNNQDKHQIKYNEEEEVISSSEDDNVVEKEEVEPKEEESEKEESPAISENSKNEIDPIDFLDDDNNFQNDKLNELLFCVQGIGEFKLNEKNEKTKIYEKGKFCEPSLRDIHRFLRKDDNENPICKYAILNWKVCESDIIPLLLANENNDKISLLCLVILVDLTEPLPDVVENRDKLVEMLFKLVQHLITSGVIELLGRGLSDATKNLSEAIEIKTMLKKENEEMLKKKKEKEEALKKKQEEEEDKKKEETTINNQNGKEESSNEKKEAIMQNNNEKEKDTQVGQEDVTIKKNSIENQEKNNANQEEKDEEKMKIDIEDKNDEENKTIKQQKELKRQVAEIELKATRLIELYLALLKQIISFYSVKDLPEASASYSQLMIKFSKLKILDAIIYYSSLFNNPTATSNSFIHSISSSLLSIMFYFNRLFTPKSVLDNSIPIENSKIQSRPMTELQRLVQLEELENEERKKMRSTRPNAFGTRIQVIRPIDNSSFVVSNVNQLMNNPKQFISEKTNTFNEQKHKGGRKKTIFRNKKIPMSKIAEEVKMINDIRLKSYFSTSVEISQISFNETMQKIKKFFDDFKKNCLNGIVSYYYIMFDREDELDKYDIYNLIGIMSFFIEYNRLSNYKEVKSQKEEKIFDLSQIQNCLTNNMINYMYNLLLEQTVMKKNEEQKIFLIFPIVNYLKQVIYVSFDSYKFQKSEDDLNLIINVVIQDNLFSKDFTKILKILYSIFNDAYHPVEILYDIIEFSEIYFSALEFFSKKRNLKIKKMKKSKKNKKEVENDEDYLKKLSKQMLKQNNSQSESEESESEDEDNYIEQDLNAYDESKCLVDYSIIDKIMLLFKDTNNYSTNSFDLTKHLLELKTSEHQILKFLSKLLDRIATKTKCEWIFFQIEYLLVFNLLLNNNFFQTDEAYQKIKSVILKIIHEYFQNLKKNKMLPIESLFHFNSISLVESIVNNYETDGDKDYKQINEADFDFDREFKPEEGEEYYKPEPKENKPKKNVEKEEKYSSWNIDEDKTLVNIYFDNVIKNDETGEVSNMEKILEELKKSLTNKTEDDLRHRIKKLKVKKGKERALKKIDKIYHLGKYAKKEKNKKGKNVSDFGNLTELVLQLSEKSKDETYKNKLKYVMNLIIKQLESTKARKEIMGDEKVECVIIPTSPEEIEIIGDENFLNLLLAIGFHKESEFIKLDDAIDIVDITIIQDKLEQCLKMINENVEIKDQEREHKKEIHKKKHKHKKHNFISEFINDRNEDNDKDNIENDENIDKNYNNEEIEQMLEVNTSNKKRKKLKKKRNMSNDDEMKIDDELEKSNKPENIQNNNDNEEN